MMKKTLIYLMMALSLSACVYPYDVELDGNVEPSLVIDANILVGSTSTVRLSYMQPVDVGLRDRPSGSISGLVYLEDESGNTYQGSNVNGVYTIDSFEARENQKYRLSVVYDNRVYRSEWIEPVAAPEITDVQFSATDSQVLVLLSLKDNNGSGYAAATYEEIWKFHADYLKTFGYDESTNSVSSLMAPDDSLYWCWNKKVSGSQVVIDYSSLHGEAGTGGSKRKCVL